MTKRYWWILIVYILMQLSGLIGIPVLFGMGMSREESAAAWSMGSFIAALIVIIFLVLPERKTTRHPHLRKSSAGQAVKWAILGVFMAFIAQYIAILIETYALGIEPGSQNTQDILSVVELFPLFAVIVAVIGPILEEVVFRKVIFGAFYKRFNFVISALLSSLIFSVVHFDFTHVLIYTAVGFTFSFLYVKTGRILVPIIAHVSMNSYAILVQVLLGEQLQDMQEELEQLNFILGGLVL
ncbi:CPBP family intramembrane glutamic endopeptidase [Salibacterium aidingense]|uniref:CPBP family intramembrane glutamic endopeptidase n=1 Tax=Salibacterium aidingense TaxID=384933 RepID=UPI00041C4734|nr:type II CAAX endopeptidase family protein [Salibacterium aidingense]